MTRFNIWKLSKLQKIKTIAGEDEEGTGTVDETLRIDFGRDPCFTMGYDNWASCTTPDGVTHSIPRLPHAERKGQQDGIGATGHGGTVYRLIIMLCDAGWEGYPFYSFDGRIPCLTGTVSRKSVPVAYGGERKTEPEV